MPLAEYVGDSLPSMVVLVFACLSNEGLPSEHKANPKPEHSEGVQNHSFHPVCKGMSDVTPCIYW